jgi:NAD(P) transhydrogenase subunit alpha
MLTYAAGTIRPAKVLVIGAGVAGLQAIATAKSIGAMVEAYDVRPETREQIESLGAKFVDTGVSAAGAGGYARELTDEEKAQAGRTPGQGGRPVPTRSSPPRRSRQARAAHHHRDMVARMKPGAVVVDMAARPAATSKARWPAKKPGSMTCW